MLDPRIYRAAFIPVLFALVLAAFSLENRPRALQTNLAPLAFDGLRAFQSLGNLADPDGGFPDRRPGSPGDSALGREVAQRLQSNGFKTRTIERTAQTIDGERTLQTVIGERTGTADGRIVIVAHRDAAGRGAKAELSGTAGLLELARLYGAPRQTNRTLTLVSTTGGTGGAAGARALADQLDDRPVEAVLVLGALASRELRPPFIVSWSNGLGASAPKLQRTLEEALRRETGTGAGLPRAVSQMARFALPATFSEQGELLERDQPAVLLSASGERAPAADAVVSEERLVTFGRAVLRTITALDDGAPVAPEATSRDLLTSRKVLPAWAVRLFVGALLLPPFVAAIDAFARIRRRGESVAGWLTWLLVTSLPFVAMVLLALLMGFTGLLSATPDAPTDPEVLPPEAAGLFAMALAFVLGWLARPAILRALGADRDPATPGAVSVVTLVAIAVSAVVWLRNPYTALMLVPALHLWLFALAPEFRRRAPAGIALALLGVLPVVLMAALLSDSLGIGPVDAAWVALLSVAGGHVSLPTAVLWCALGGCAAGAVLIASRGSLHAGDEDTPITVRGPRSYAGPGSLGGTDSGFRR